MKALSVEAWHSSIQFSRGPWLQVLVAAIPFAQCFVLGTKLAPEMTDQVTALTARACQTMCERTEGCGLILSGLCIGGSWWINKWFQFFFLNGPSNCLLTMREA
jgi:hypothetical protein